ncbi:DUF2267 domain-containing protein [Saccharopolyspora rhizosphaerae]|uniref:DUF2267 domain-containing protein n=1 Tax=Saccharopolyspora rhizosphaerae TaxID=2492662 RepID=A0A426JMF0_9PSEU|nr:DUF2267 domain-containing protein [Saccharopolyspora rhizosphaerae]RRO14197.1 DUF2267 domain-containing protein [Saccharopolyspora rhizosphaerae]
MTAWEGGSIRVGLVADPGVPTEIAERLAEELPDELRDKVADVDWQVRASSEGLPLSEEGTIEIAAKASEMGRSDRWDLLICLTDLPRIDPAGTVVAEADASSGAALASVPAIGSIRLLPYARRVVVHLVGLLARESLRLTTKGDYHAGAWGVFGTRVRQVPSHHEDIDANLVLPGRLGRMRLLFGMVRDNRPWRLVLGLSRAVAAAAGTAAFGVFFPSIWTLSDSLAAPRLVLINFFAVAVMAGWLVVHNSLWERPGRSAGVHKTRIYNAATALTVTVGVICMYALLFAVTTLGAAIVISPEYLGTQLGHPAGALDYLGLSWLASSMGTVAGALGSSLETEAAVRRATYSRRERERRERRRREQQESRQV